MKHQSSRRIVVAIYASWFMAAFQSSSTDATALQRSATPPGTIAGKVLWNDRGIEGITIRLCGVAWRIEHGRKQFGTGLPVYDGCLSTDETQTGADGAYRFEGVAAGEYVLMARNGRMWVFMSNPRRSVRLIIDRKTPIDVTPYTVAAGRTTTPDSIALIRGLELVSPIRGAAADDPRPLLTWKAIEGATRYRVSVSKAEFGRTLAGTPAPPGVSVDRIVEQAVGVAELRLARKLAPGDYVWWVEAFNAAGTKLAESWNYYTTMQHAPEDIGHFAVIAP